MLEHDTMTKCQKLGIINPEMRKLTGNLPRVRQLIHIYTMMRIGRLRVRG